MSARITEEALAELARRAQDSAVAYINGDAERYLELIRHAPGYTLTPPTGGAPAQHADRAAGVRESAGIFHGGEATLELSQAHAWDDTVVLVAIERQHGQVGGLPDQDWSLRVTLVFRRDGADWLLVHRHADPLVRPIGLDQMAALARGDASG